MNCFKTTIAAGASREQKLEDTSNSPTGEDDLGQSWEDSQVTRSVPQKVPTRKGRIPGVAALVAWVFRYNKKLVNVARLGQEQVVRRLLEKGAKVAAKDGSGWTALHWAAYRGHERV